MSIEPASDDPLQSHQDDSPMPLSTTTKYDIIVATQNDANSPIQKDYDAELTVTDGVVVSFEENRTTPWEGSETFSDHPAGSPSPTLIPDTNFIPDALKEQLQSHPIPTTSLAGEFSSPINQPGFINPITEQLKNEEEKAAKRTAEKATEDNTTTKWQLRKKHFFIMTNAAKPIFSRYGDENALAPFFCIMQALVSFSNERKDAIRSIEAGSHRIVFLIDDPFYLVAVSRAGEGEQFLRCELYFLMQSLISIVSSNQKKNLLKYPSRDIRGAIGDAEGFFCPIITDLSFNPSYFLETFSTFPISPDIRKDLREAIKHTAEKTEKQVLKISLRSCLLFLIVSVNKHILVLSRNKDRKESLHPLDLILLLNNQNTPLMMRQDSSFSPICLPKFTPDGFLYAFRKVEYWTASGAGAINSPIPLSLILLTHKPNPDALQVLQQFSSFFSESLSTNDLIGRLIREVETFLSPSLNLVEEDIFGTTEPKPTGKPLIPLRVQPISQVPFHFDFSFVYPCSSTPISGLAPPNLRKCLHFAFFSPVHHQHISSAFNPPFHTKSAQKTLMSLYHRLFEHLQSDCLSIEFDSVIRDRLDMEQRIARNKAEEERVKTTGKESRKGMQYENALAPEEKLVEHNKQVTEILQSYANKSDFVSSVGLQTIFRPPNESALLMPDDYATPTNAPKIPPLIPSLPIPLLNTYFIHTPSSYTLVGAAVPDFEEAKTLYRANKRRRRKDTNTSVIWDLNKDSDEDKNDSGKGTGKAIVLVAFDPNVGKKVAEEEIQTIVAWVKDNNERLFIRDVLLW
ncbi:putative Vacuolar fusion protein MON1 like protein [Blattamonas nauphoetae]|uniref:Vacuolar fusion protein MON1 like protein n=1 Tax=Blattamonas nauphoetae TaxID=2049346 RepID=A0ABQ9XXN5_9EUKA|nr:putative Vacuolar fusion protein MON1 like protein [Blattamonas nauphoetae]